MHKHVSYLNCLCTFVICFTFLAQNRSCLASSRYTRSTPPTMRTTTIILSLSLCRTSVTGANTSSNVQLPTPSEAQHVPVLLIASNEASSSFQPPSSFFLILLPSDPSQPCFRLVVCFPEGYFGRPQQRQYWFKLYTSLRRHPVARYAKHIKWFSLRGLI